MSGVTLDQLARFDAVMELVREVNGSSLLDVGSGSSGLGALLGPSWEVTAVDSDFSDYGAASGPADDHVTRIRADSRSLPFPDRGFDVVVAVDLLEHIDPSGRASVLSELGRVAGGRLIVACPAGSEALAADRRLADRYRRRGGEVPGWLDEHLEREFPEGQELIEGLRPLGPTELRLNESIRARDRLLSFQSHTGGGLASRLAAAALKGGLGRRGPRSLILRLMRGRDRPPAYRTIVFADRREASQPSTGTAS